MKKRRSGFTLIEVMMALGVIACAIGGLIAIQTMILRMNAQARHLQIGSDIAQTWAERLKLDGVLWTNQTGLANTQWLGAGIGAPGAWIPTGVADMRPDPEPSRSGEFDVFGNDVAPGSADSFYCVSLRFNWVLINSSMRAEVRVKWPREQTFTMPDCDAVNADPLLWHLVTLPVVINQTQVQ